MGEEEWIARVRSTLSALGLIEPTVRDEILRQVRDAVRDLDAADGGPRALDTDDPLDLDDPVHADDLTATRVSTAADDATDHRTTPRLRLIDTVDDEPPQVRVKVVRHAHTPAPAEAADLTDGHLRVSGSEDVWQTFVHGETPATYRVHCDEGELHVAVDDEVVCRLEHGQSADVRGVMMRVRATTSAGARGRYRRLCA